MPQTEADPSSKNEPKMVFLPQQTSEKELKDGITVSGSAASGKVGPLIGSIDIFESDENYLFRVALPGVKRDENFQCDIQPDGMITIQGVTTTGEKTVHTHNMVFEMHTQNLCPPGDFSVSFQLPGPVDPTTLKHMLANGVFEGVVQKKPLESM